MMSPLMQRLLDPEWTTTAYIPPVLPLRRWGCQMFSVRVGGPIDSAKKLGRFFLKKTGLN